MSEKAVNFERTCRFSDFSKVGEYDDSLPVKVGTTRYRASERVCPAHDTDLGVELFRCSASGFRSGSNG